MIIAGTDMIYEWEPITFSMLRRGDLFTGHERTGPILEVNSHEWVKDNGGGLMVRVSFTCVDRPRDDDHLIDALKMLIGHHKIRTYKGTERTLRNVYPLLSVSGERIQQAKESLEKLC